MSSFAGEWARFEGLVGAGCDVLVLVRALRQCPILVHRAHRSPLLKRTAFQPLSPHPVTNLSDLRSRALPTAPASPSPRTCSARAVNCGPDCILRVPTALNDPFGVVLILLTSALCCLVLYETQCSNFALVAIRIFSPLHAAY